MDNDEEQRLLKKLEELRNMNLENSKGVSKGNF
jgi:hypothetical protein